MCIYIYVYKKHVSAESLRGIRGPGAPRGPEDTLGRSVVAARVVLWGHQPEPREGLEVREVELLDYFPVIGFIEELPGVLLGGMEPVDKNGDLPLLLD